MTADRLFFPAVLAACAALAALAATEPVRVAGTHAKAQAAAPVVQLERVVIVAPRLDAPRQLADAGADAAAAVVR